MTDEQKAVFEKFDDCNSELNASNTVDGTHSYIYINGGTFKSEIPKRTINITVRNGAEASVIISGGSFWEYNPALHSTYHSNGDDVRIADGYSEITNRDARYFLHKRREVQGKVTKDPLTKSARYV